MIGSLVNGHTFRCARWLVSGRQAGQCFGWSRVMVESDQEAASA
ncbi:hypothetical protein ACTMU2_14540 [Cupriavidus basilensis]